MPELPDAEVKNLGSLTVTNGSAEDGSQFDGDYYIYDLIGGNGLTTATDPFDLTIAMQFIAKDTAEEAAANFFANYTTDFFLEMKGMSGESFVGDGCYLAGYYPSFDAWVLIPLDGFTVENGKVYPVITSAGFDFKYVDICSSVENFICGIYLTPEVLAANPDLNVTLSLGLSKDMDAALAAEFKEVDAYTYTAEELAPKKYAAQIGTKKYETFADALEAANAGDTIVLLEDVWCYGEVAINKSVTIDGNGFSFIADPSYSGWYTTSSKGIKSYKVYPLAIKANDVTLKDVILDCNSLGKGLDILAYNNIVLDNVTVKNEKGNAININGANVILRNKITSNNLIGGGTNYSIVAEEGVILAVNAIAFQGTCNYANTNMDGAKKADGTSYFAIKSLDANGNVAKYENKLPSSLGDGYTYILLKDVTQSSNATLVWKDSISSATIDLNGYTLTIASGKIIGVQGNLYFKNEGTVVGRIELAATDIGVYGSQNLPVSLNAGVPADMFCVAYANGNHYIAEIKLAVVMNDVEYATLAEAMAEANKAAGNYTIQLLDDNAEEFSFAQNAGVSIVIDGEGKTFTGKITLGAGAGTLTLTDMVITPSNADAKTIVLNASTAPDVIIDGCTMKNVGTKGAIVWGQASTTTNKVVIKNSTASNLQYLVGTNQGGCDDITVENVTATDMAYLIRPMKATKVTVKDVTYSGLTFIQVKNSLSCMLVIENVTVTTTQAGMPPVTMLAPDSGNGATYTIGLKGTNVANGAEMTKANEADWFARANESNPYVILMSVVRNGSEEYFTLADAIAVANAGDNLVLIRNTDEGFTLDKSLTLDLNSKSLTGEIKLAVGATLTAPEGLNVVALVDGNVIMYENGAYASIAWKIYTNVVLTDSFKLSYAFPMGTDAEKWEGAYVLVNGEKITDDKWTHTTIGGADYLVIDFAGIAAKQMCDTVTFAVYDKDGNQIGSTTTTSIQKYMMSKLNKSTDAKLSTLIVDILNYGAEAQLFFGYNTEKLANSELTDAQKALASAGRAYTSVTQKEYAEGYDFDILFNVVLENNIRLKLGFDLRELELSDSAVAVVKYTDANGVAHRMELEVKNYKEDIFLVKVDSLMAVDASAVITCEIRDGGVTIAKATYSVESYAAGVIAKYQGGNAEYEKKAVMAEALMKYCDSAKTYFVK